MIVKNALEHRLVNVIGGVGSGNDNTALEAAFFMEKRNTFTDGIAFLNLVDFESPK